VNSHTELFMGDPVNIPVSLELSEPGPSSPDIRRKTPRTIRPATARIRMRLS
jgi:hypothetical protein